MLVLGGMDGLARELDLAHYLFGVAQILLLAGSAWLGASSVRSRLVPELSGAPAHLTSSVLALALMIWSAELLGSFGAFEPLPYLLLVAVVGVGSWALLRRVAGGEGGRGQLGPQRPPDPLTGPAGRTALVPTLIAFAIATLAILKFALETKTKLGTGMSGFDSTWYHGPFAAEYMQSGNTWDLHFIAPQFLAWFYPANSELLHAVGMNAFERDLLSPLLNLGWFAGCLVACWCIGRPYRVAPWTLVLGAVALSVPALSDQAGEARNDIVGIFFLLAAVAVALNAWRDGLDGGKGGGARVGLPLGAVAVVGLGAGLAAGTKLNFLLPCTVLVLGLAAAAPRGRRLPTLAAGGVAAAAGGGYWYLRNLVHTGNPLPWFDNLGPLTLPAPDQALGGREAHSVLSYLTDGAVWADWFLPGLREGLWIVWPLLLGGALAGIGLCLFAGNGDDDRERAMASGRATGASGGGGVSTGGARLPGRAGVLRVAALTGLAAVLAWLVAPTSASGPEGVPRGFESALRYLAPALVLGLALLPIAAPLRTRLNRLDDAAGRIGFPGDSSGYGADKSRRNQPAAHAGMPRGAPAAAAAVLLVAVAAGYFVQREYLERRYGDPAFAAPGLNKAFALAGDWDGAAVATTSTRQYPLFGTTLSNRVEFVGEERPHGGFVAPPSCRAWRRLLNEGGYTFVVASRDRIEPGKPPYPETARWTEGPGATVVFREPPTVVLELSKRLDPSTCAG